MIKVRFSKAILVVALGLSVQGFSAGTVPGAVPHETARIDDSRSGIGTLRQDPRDACIENLVWCYENALYNPGGDPGQCYGDFNECINACDDLL